MSATLAAVAAGARLRAPPRLACEMRAQDDERPAAPCASNWIASGKPLRG
jgi:hypothetical protein